jgi:hypothetical protein
MPSTAMVKHAFLITAYKDPVALLELLRCLDQDGVVYLHIDKRSVLSDEALEALRHYPSVRLLSRRYRVHWGGSSHVKAILELSRAAVADGMADRIHLLSGSDRPILPTDAFRSYFEVHRSAEFLLHFPLPTPYWKGGGLDRLTLYHPLDLLDLRSHRQRAVRDLVLRLQLKLGVHRRLAPLPPLFGGSTWWSLTRDCVAHVLEQMDQQPGILRRLRMTHVPEEVLFPTLVMNSRFAPQVVNDNLRHIHWTPRDGQNPAVLDLRDLDAIRSSGKLFARKLEHPTSTSLMKALDELRRTDGNA